MANQTPVIWFPNGDAEICARIDVPLVGDRLTRQEQDWSWPILINAAPDRAARVTPHAEPGDTRRFLANAV